jgi:hypothetical protein
MTLNITDLRNELANLKDRYSRELESLEQRVADARSAIVKRDSYSDHGPFNMSATCQNLAVLAGKIEEVANVIRWAEQEVK